MADKTRGEDIVIRWRDMGDGTWAMVMAAHLLNALPAGTNLIGSVNVGTVAQEWFTGYVEDETLLDSDKNWQIPVGEEWHVLSVWVKLITSGEAGNRLIAVNWQAPNWTDVIGEVRVGATQAASQTRYYTLAPSLADLTAFRDTDWLMTPLPPGLILPENYYLRIWDQNQIAPAGDTMIVRVLRAYRSI